MKDDKPKTPDPITIFFVSLPFALVYLAVCVWLLIAVLYGYQILISLW